MSPNLCVHMWDEIEDALPSTMMISFLLWAFGMEDTIVVMVGTTQKTYREWLRIVVEKIYLTHFYQKLRLCSCGTKPQHSRNHQYL